MFLRRVLTACSILILGASTWLPGKLAAARIGNPKKALTHMPQSKATSPVERNRAEDEKSIEIEDCRAPIAEVDDAIIEPLLGTGINKSFGTLWRFYLGCILSSMDLQVALHYAAYVIATEMLLPHTWVAFQ